MSRELVQGLSSAAPIEELALRFARDAYPMLRLENELRRFDALAAPLAARLAGEREHRSIALTMGEYLHDEVGLSGDEGDYHDPRNSYLNEVLDRRVGLPISLAAIWMAVGRRVGVHVDGIGFPGHFLVRVGREPGVLVDPFREGALVNQGELERLAIHHLGGVENLRADHLIPVDTRAMLVRMLVNLKHAHERRGDHARALVVCDRLVDLTDAATFRRDRGLHAHAMGAMTAALADLDAYLDSGAPEGDAELVRTIRDRLAYATKRRLS
jgi:regulator of sirC expression with transglutaminase-like and TPR domain